MMMAADTVLEVDNVHKLYARAPGRSRQRLREALALASIGITPRINRTRGHEFWAVKGISFSMRRGEAVGVIGLNGSGKTTLLRMIAGQIPLDRGEIRIAGRSASVIALTAGLQPSASGRQNVVLRSAMLGRSRAETMKKIDEIIAFTELGDAIEAPVTTYSSGMTVRLAFAITVFTEPDILLIDETLSVGDFTFRQKCMTKIRELRNRCAFVLVSHSMNDIQRFCDRALVLDKGTVAFEGAPDEAVAFYREEFKPAKRGEPHVKLSKAVGEFFRNADTITDIEHYWCDAEGKPIEEITAGEDLYLRVGFTLGHAPRKLSLGVPVWTEAGEYVTGFSSDINGVAGGTSFAGRHEYVLAVPALAFNAGDYVSNLGVLDGPEFLLRAPNPPLRVLPRSDKQWGVVTLPHEWRRLDEDRAQGGGRSALG